MKRGAGAGSGGGVVVVVGAGVLGLSIARAVAAAARGGGFGGSTDVCVVERHGGVARETSARSSQVIHAGLYYEPPQSHKARFCVQGKRRLYEFCRAFDVPHRQCGKLIVATTPSSKEHAEQQKRQLAGIYSTARSNGVEDLVWLTPDDVRNSFEPQVQCNAALFSPSTGILDSHALMLALQGDAEAHGALFAFNTSVVGGRYEHAKLFLETRDEITSKQYEMECDAIINCAGLSSISVARSFQAGSKHAASIVKQPTWYAKGNYFKLTGQSPFQHLVYPLPNQAGLGLHATVDMLGQCRFGPNVDWVNKIEYSVDEDQEQEFYDTIREYWPDLPDGSLMPDYAGIRPKVVGPNEPPHDFVIHDELVHGIPNLIHLHGMESPGLTSSLAIGDHVVNILERPLQRH